jgi:hypothetical protein
MTFGNAGPLALVVLGLMLGIRHATDPDHVIAVTALLTRERRLGAATRVGFVWGLGHTLTVLLVGAAIIIFKLKVPLRLGLSMEFAVAVVLILLGLGAAGKILYTAGARLRLISSADRKLLEVHSHAHSHVTLAHRHTHTHPHAHAVKYGSVQDAIPLHDSHLPSDAAFEFPPGRSLLTSFGIGLVHGLAGSAAIALLVLSAIPEPKWALIYLVIFCVGVVLGMVLITAIIGAPFMLISKRMAGIHRGLTLGAGLLSFGFGLFLAYQIAVVDKLLGAAPIWIAH